MNILDVDWRRQGSLTIQDLCSLSNKDLTRSSQHFEHSLLFARGGYEGLQGAGGPGVIARGHKGLQRAGYKGRGRTLLHLEGVPLPAHLGII